MRNVSIPTAWPGVIGFIGESAGTGRLELVRDARIRLTQGAPGAQEDDLGLVPLMHPHGRYRLSEYTTLVVDFDDAWSPQGRALDVGLRAERDYSDGW
jgi:hypothetical protein